MKRFYACGLDGLSDEPSIVRHSTALVLASDHDIVVNGLQSLIAGLRHELKLVKAERDRLAGAKHRPKIKPLIEIGTKRDGAVITGHDCGLHVLKCRCGAIFRRGREALIKDQPWRCKTCVNDAHRANTLEIMAEMK